MSAPPDSVLAGLGFAFEPISLKKAGADVVKPAKAAPRLSQPLPAAATAAGAAAAPASGAASPRVAFNLKHRRPGPAYGSPETQPDAQQQQQQQQLSCAGAPAAGSRVNGTALLKLASLRRRTAPMQHGAPSPGPPSVARAAGAALAAKPEGTGPPCAPAAAAGREEDADAGLLNGMECLLAECASRVLDDPPPELRLPEHMLLGMPALAIPPAVPALDADSPTEPGGLIAAHRPTAAGSSDAAASPAAVVQAAAAGSSAEAAAAASTGGSGTSADCQQQQPVPATLEQALGCLGLLHPGRVDSRSDDGGSGGGGGETRQWVRLRAMQVVLEAKRQAGTAAELRPLAQRLCQVRVHLEYHKANLQRGRTRSPGRGSSSSASAAALPPGPWLSGRSSAMDSKHRAIRAASPGGTAAPKPKVAPPSQEASELQVQLLGSLQQKLLLKLGVAALRQAAAQARLRQQLLEHVAAQAAADLAGSVLLGWHAAAVPSAEQEEAAQSLAEQQARRRQQSQWAAWRQWAARHAWQQRQLGRGQRQLRRRLLTAALQHWRCYCQQQLVQRLHYALAARWLAAWSLHRPFAAWRQAARRSAALKAALLMQPSKAAPALADSKQPQLRRAPSTLDALAATAAAFQPVKAYVADAAQQLECLRRGLCHHSFRARCSMAQPEAAAAEAEQSEQQATQLPMASVESLLAALPAPRRQETQPVLLPPLPPPPLQQQQQQGVSLLASSSMRRPAAAAAAMVPPANLDQQGAAGAAPAAAAGAGPAQDPGSPPAYNPASYASPAQLQRKGRRRHGSWAMPAVEPPAAVEAELLDCQEQVERLRRELAELEQESTELQQQCAELEQLSPEAQQAVVRLQQARAGATADKEAAAAAMQTAVQRYSDVFAEYAQQERQLQQLQQECREAAAAEAGAQAAALAAAERQAVAGMAVQRWRKAVDGIAKELAACHRTQQAPVLVRLKEARQQLERHQHEAAAAAQQGPELQAAAAQVAQRAQAAQAVALDAQQRLVMAAERRAQLQRELDGAMARHEAAAVAAVAAEQQASAAERRQRLLAAQQQAAAGQLRQAAQRVLRKQQAAVLLQQQVQELQQRHRHAVAATLAAEQAEQRRGKLKRRLVVPPLGEPSPALQPAMPGEERHRQATVAAAGPSDGPGASSPVHSSKAASVAPGAGQLVVHVPVNWSSSELSSPEADVASPPPPLTVDEAAARFYCHCLARRALRMLRLEAQAADAALQAAAESWRQRHQAAVLHAWRINAAEAADWLAAASAAIRRRGLLRRLRAVVAERRWQREAEALADSFARHKLLTAGVLAWRQHVRHELWRDDVHEAVMVLRMRNMLRGWRAWARRRRPKAVRLRAAQAIYERRLLAAALRQWCWVQHSKAVLQRVFSTAVELWQDEVGVRLHQRNYELAQSCWAAWQLYVLQAQEQRRQAMLRNAALAFRERQLLMAGLDAFRSAVAHAAEQRRLAVLQAEVFDAWRMLAAMSARHWHYGAARQQRQHFLLRAAMQAWRAANEATATQIDQFYLRWQVEQPLRQALQAWWQTAAAQRQQQVLNGMAAVHRERQLQRLGLVAFATNARAACPSCQQQQQQQPPARLHSKNSGPAAGAERQLVPEGQTAGVPAGQAGWPQPQQARAQLGGAASAMTIIISRRSAPAQASAEQQEQVPPCVSSRSDNRSATAAAQGMLQAVSDWRAAADYWRQRHERFSVAQQRQPQQAHHQQQQPCAPAQHAAALRPETAATLTELRTQWQHQ